MSEELWECVVAGASPEEVWAVVTEMGVASEIQMQVRDTAGSGRLVKISAPWVFREVNADTLSSRLGCTVFQRVSVSGGIDYSRCGIAHRGEWLFEEGDHPNGYEYIRVAKGAPELRADSKDQLSHVKSVVRQALVKQLGQTAIELLEGNPYEFFEVPGSPER